MLDCSSIELRKKKKTQELLFAILVNDSFSNFIEMEVLKARRKRAIRQSTRA